MSMITEDMYKKSEINSSLLPMVSYQPTSGTTSTSFPSTTSATTSYPAGGAESSGLQDRDVSPQGIRGSEMSTLATVSQICPEGLEEVDENAPETGSRRRGSRTVNVDVNGGDEALL